MSSIPWLTLAALAVFLSIPATAAGPKGFDESADLSHPRERTIELAAGETVEVSAGIVSPSKLPPNGRLAVEWSAPGNQQGFRKILHALDPDVYTVYRAPAAGRFTLKIQPVTDEEPDFNQPRWRENGIAGQVMAFPRLTPWPAATRLPGRIAVKPVSFGVSSRGMIVEAEPNDSIELAQTIPLAPGPHDQTVHVTAGADDIEYFDNGRFGRSGEDWYRIEFPGPEPRLLTVNMTLTDPFVAARLRFYTPDGQEYKEGMNANERTHQQEEDHRTAISRTLKPGQTYFLRAEANSPGYEIELRVRRPAPYSDPREAIRQSMYDHIAQVDAWILNRPRGNSLDRRIRDTGTLYGTNCMSCHTQSGVWGPAGAIRYGYRVENVLNYRHLANVMYESLRPTNFLKDAANNTSLPPHDLGDGPAGTRVAGHNVLMLERVLKPRKLHSAQQIRTANYVLQTADPGGINAAGKGSNVGQSVVFHYASEILREAWDRTGKEEYLRGIEQKAESIVGVLPRFTDDMAHRIVFFRRVFPKNYLELRGGSLQARNLVVRAEAQIEVDRRRLLESQREDGAWGFEPGVVDKDPDPAPTALAIDALYALGYQASDPVIARAVEALLQMQDPYGRWNRSAQTGFVTTAYVLNTLAALYPETPAAGPDFQPKPGEPLADTIARFRAMAYFGTPAGLDLMLAGAAHASPQVRYWAMLALGSQNDERAVPALIGRLGDPVKMVREAARWGLRQTLLDDKGWDQIFAAYDQGGDRLREHLAAALVMRADAVLSDSSVDLLRLASLFDRMMNEDSSPAVRAWAGRAAWNWWVFNPPIRQRLNLAFAKLLERPEPSVLAENAIRFQMQALFIANGNRASGTQDHQYTELADLFELILNRQESARARDRIVGIAATYYNTGYGANGTGSLGYATKHSPELVGKSVLDYWERAEKSSDFERVQLAIEAAANGTFPPMQKKLLDYAVNGPEKLRPIATASLSDPRSVKLPATPEFVEPLLERVRRAASGDDEARNQARRSVIAQMTNAKWDLSSSEERQRIFFNLLVPTLDDPASDAQWWLAQTQGGIAAANPDMRTPVFVSLAPQQFRHPLEEHFWLPSVPWWMNFEAPLPEVGRPVSGGRQELRQQALQLYLRQLRPEADKRNRDLAVILAAEPALRGLPEVAEALRALDSPAAARHLPETFERELDEALLQDQAGAKLMADEKWRRNFAYFRDHVLPAMNTPNRDDNLSCFGCHGVAGRVPSMELASPDRRTGYIAAKETWRNYRILIDRISDDGVEKSRLLRKPLDIQTGKEDGHQGGRRYLPGDRGHEILRRWARDVAEIRRGS